MKTDRKNATNVWSFHLKMALCKQGPRPAGRSHKNDSSKYLNLWAHAIVIFYLVQYKELIFEHVQVEMKILNPDAKSCQN